MSRRHTARVRRRLTVSVALVSVAVLAAGAPAVLLALDDTTDAQHLVDLAETNRGAVTLAHALADERDAMTRYVAAGRTTASGGGVSEDMRARVDRRIREVRPDVPAPVRRLLDDLPELRQQALTGKGSALDVFTSYTKAVQALNGIADTLVRGLPADADSGATAALAPLGRAVEEASATRGLLLAALDGGGSQDALVSAAQRTNLREQSALADFEQLAPSSTRESYDHTVNGTEVTAAERYIARLTDQSRLAGNDFFLNEDRVESGLNARIDRMRGAQSSLASSEAAHLARLRDDAVTDLEVRIGIVGAALLFALGVSVHSARSMTRPLAALRLGARRVAADPAAEEPIAFKGRDDEFADAVRAINELHAKAARTSQRVAELGKERTRLVGERQRLADERDGLRAERDAVATRLEGLRARVHGSFVSLALRSLGLIERQLAIIESLEEREQDPDRLETLFQLDHLATGMRRYGENLLVIAGSEHKATHPGPVPLLDVLRASISEVERYDRVQIQALPPHAQVAGYAADSVSHLVAELLENATSFSPPDAPVQVSGWLLETGEVMLSVQDEGIGMTPERFIELNDRLADPVPEYCQGPQPEDPLGLGLYVVTRLAARHGIRVQLREQQPGGVAAVVVLPTKILPAGPPGAGLPPAPPVGVGATFGSTGLSSFPGSEAEANSNTLPGQTRTAAQEPEDAPGPETNADAGPPTEPDGRGEPDGPGASATLGAPGGVSGASGGSGDGQGARGGVSDGPGVPGDVSGASGVMGGVSGGSGARGGGPGAEPDSALRAAGSALRAVEADPAGGPMAASAVEPEAALGLEAAPVGPASDEAGPGEAGPLEAALAPESAAPWAVSGERWGQAADAVRDDDYRMEPTPPRGHPSPGTGGALPALPKRVPKSTRATGQDGARQDADDSAPARASEAGEPEVPAVERTMELTLHRESHGSRENHGSRDSHEGRERHDDPERQHDREDRENLGDRGKSGDRDASGGRARRDYRVGGDDREDHVRRFGSHGIRPVGADAWGPADSGPAQAAPAERGPAAERGSATGSGSAVRGGPAAERGSAVRGGPAARGGPSVERGPAAQDGPAAQGGAEARGGVAVRGGLAAERGPAARGGLPEERGPAVRGGSAVRGGPAAQGRPAAESGSAAERGPAVRGGFAVRGGPAAQGRPTAQSGSAAERGPTAQSGSAAERGPATGSGSAARGGSATDGVSAPADPYAIGPDQHARPEDEAPRTDKGLPKRTPRTRSMSLREPEPRERTGSVSAEELRHRLGGFQRGAREGRRDAAAEIAARGEAARRTGGAAGQTGAQNEGGTVEEARG
ncbi:nitrate- and nitrite sensing domain-containing protein [Streptomyces hygroscopicus]|uniref:nitrate- and nitrite sensing domain-containing protein n=1 Tax=Streptomyces hygroscopicus TaxID=1912 RepID=UPI0036AA376F